MNVDPKDCRFDPELLQRMWSDHRGERTAIPTDQWRAPDGTPRTCVYQCGDCGAYHWTTPALEADGTAASFEAAVRDSAAACERDGVAPPSEELLLEVIAAGLNPEAMGIRRRVRERVEEAV
jgi:hypothetical protein